MLSAMDYKLYWYPCPNYNPNNYNNNKNSSSAFAVIFNKLSLNLPVLLICSLAK